MITALTQATLTLAILLFALSLPFADHPAGGSLRRAAGFALVMAFVPALLACILGPIFTQPHSGARKLEAGLAGCGLAAILLVLSFAAYGFLDVAKRGKSRQPSAHGEHVRYTKHREDHAVHHEDEGDA